MSGFLPPETNVSEDFDDTNENDYEDQDLDFNDDMLSAETLQALKDFSLSLGVPCEDDDDLLASVRDHFNVQEKDEIFNMTFANEDNSRVVEYCCKGVKRELGQTLTSTGLTVWRACEHLCDYIFSHPEEIEGKSICELGAGLGLLAILMDKMGTAKEIVATDGDDDTLELLCENVEMNNSQVETRKLWWGLVEGFKDVYPDGFDLLVAADVIYESEQVVPLLDTVTQLMKPDGAFLLAFARRNVSIDVVLDAAADLGLSWTSVDWTITGGIESEPVYKFKFNEFIENGSDVVNDGVDVCVGIQTSNSAAGCNP